MRTGVSDRVLSGKRGGGGEGDAGRQRPESARRQEEESADCYLGDMLTQLNTVMSTKPSEKPSANDGMYRLNAAWYMCEKMYCGSSATRMVSFLPIMLDCEFL